MTQKAFIKVLDKKEYSYEIEGDRIVVTCKGGVDLDSLTSLPLGVEFKNGGYVYLRSLTSLPPEVVFNNKGHVGLESLTSISPGVEFRNGGSVDLSALTSLPPGVEFKNGEDVYLGLLIGGFFNKWKGNIEGIDPNRLLNKMIELGLFTKDKR